MLQGQTINGLIQSFSNPKDIKVKKTLMLGYILQTIGYIKPNKRLVYKYDDLYKEPLSWPI